MKIVVSVVMAASLFIVACGSGSSDKEESTSSKGNEQQENDSTSTDVKEPDLQDEVQKVAYDPYLNDVARVISGVPIEGTDSVLLSIQASDYYKEYQSFTDETFDKVRSTMLEPVAKWTKEQEVGDDSKNLTCFYPFSGPDFMFANAFYPTARNYVLLGLERRGTSPQFEDMSDAERKKYFQGLKHSMKYINTRGYFVTQHMGSDFSRTHLNGITHMVLYMMVQTGHKIVAIEDGWINKEGKLTRIDEHANSPEDAVRVKCIDFTGAEQKELRTLYFFNQNIQDKAVEDHMEMAEFIKSFPNRASYLKAAQCAAFNPDFTVVRELILGSQTIIQDDSGIPYKLLSDSTKYDTKLYGTYTNVISDLSWCLQRDLKKDVVEKGDNSDLPFKISYNGNYGKGVIIFSKKKQ